MLTKDLKIMRILIILFIFLLFVIGNTAYSATRIFYIDFETGKDGNNGTSKTSPWKRVPPMAGFSGSYYHQAGDQFVFKGGVTWDKTNFQMSLSYSGTSAAPDYYGVDKSWFKGTSWSRPIFDGGHTTLAQGSDIISINNINYVTIDNIEIKGYQAYSSWGRGSITLYCSQNILMTNLWVHDWSLASIVSTDDTHGGIIGNYPGCPKDGTWVDHSEISNIEAANAGRQNGGATRAIGVRFSKIHDVSAGILFGTVHDTEIYNVMYPSKNVGFDSNFHSNVAYIQQWEGAPTKPAYIYNNIIHDVNSGSGALYNCNCDTAYFFNNVIWNSFSNGGILIDPENCSAGKGASYIFNNTIQEGLIRITNRGYKYGTLVVKNNHFIQNSSEYVQTGPGALNYTNDHNVVQSQANATMQGYIIANQFQPTSLSGVSNASANPGENLTSIGINELNTDILARTRLSTGSWSLGAYQYGGVTSGSLNPPSNLLITQ